MSIDSLTQAVLDHQKGQGNYQELFHRISLMIYRFPQKFFGWSEDQASEFYLTEISNLEGVLTRFRYEGQPFKHFLANTLKWKVLHFIKRRERYDWGLEVAESDIAYEQSVELNCPDTSENSELVIPQEFQDLLAKGNGKLPPHHQRRLIYLLLKCAWFITDKHLDQAIEKTDYCPQFLQGTLAQLRENLLHAKQRLKSIQDRRSGHYSKILLYQTWIRRDPTKADKWKTLELHHRRRMQALTREASIVNFMPSHGEIARVLETPKGTVDSGLYYFRNFLRRVSKSRKKTYTKTHGNPYRLKQSTQDPGTRVHTSGRNYSHSHVQEPEL